MSAADGTPLVTPPHFKRTTREVDGGLVNTKWPMPPFSVFRRPAIDFAAPWVARQTPVTPPRKRQRLRVGVPLMSPPPKAPQMSPPPESPTPPHMTPPPKVGVALLVNKTACTHRPASIAAPPVPTPSSSSSYAPAATLPVPKARVLTPHNKETRRNVAAPVPTAAPSVGPPPVVVTEEPPVASLTKKEKQDFAKVYLPSDFIDQCALMMPVCPQYVASRKVDPVTGKKGRSCRDGILCKKLHCDETATDEEKKKTKQKYNLPYVSVYSMSTVHGDCRIFVRPPWKEAFKAYDAHVLGDDASPRISAIEHVRVMGVPYIKLSMTNQVAPSSTSLSACNSMAMPVVMADGVLKMLRTSGKAVPADRYFVHGTGITEFSGIYESRRLIASSSSEPVGVYGYPTGDLSLPQAYARDVIIGFEMHGGVLDMANYELWETSHVPADTMGFLNRFTKSAEGKKIPQWLCHPAGTRVVHIFVKQVTLHVFLNEQLDGIGYSRVYHDAVMKADDLVRSKFATASGR